MLTAGSQGGNRYRVSVGRPFGRWLWKANVHGMSGYDIIGGFVRYGTSRERAIERAVAAADRHFGPNRKYEEVRVDGDRG